jgi:RNA polymerase sigma-70 factor, ECF subfamily
MDERDPTDGALVARTRRGDSTAFDLLVRRHYRAAYAVALAILRLRSDAEDICQDAWVRALERIDECREPDRFVHWLLQIVRNRARNHLDYRRVRSSEPLDDGIASGTASDQAGPGQDLDRKRLRERLEQSLAGLSEVQREIVLLHDLEGWSHGDIARLLEISEVMSRQHLFQARRRLRETLGPNARGDLTHDG